MKNKKEYSWFDHPQNIKRLKIGFYIVLALLVAWPLIFLTGENVVLEQRIEARRAEEGVLRHGEGGGVRDEPVSLLDGRGDRPDRFEIDDRRLLRVGPVEPGIEVERDAPAHRRGRGVRIQRVSG